MIRLVQRKLIIPRGDTGSFSIPVIKPSSENVAVFTIFDDLTHTRLFQKKLTSEDDVLNITFTHNETVNLKPGKYLWDIKYYSNPLFVEDELVGGDEVDSYYAGYSLPVCEIRPTGDDYLISDDAPSGTLAPDQLDIITNAIIALNEAVEKTQTNVEHYPIIRDETWYVWDAESNDYVSTEVSANGIVGNGIASAVLNDDYSLTLNFTDGTSFTTSSIRGETGNGIDDIVLNNDFTLTIIYTDGERYTTPSIRGPVGATPQFSIGTVQDGAVAAASITGTAENPVLNLTLPNAHVPTKVSQLENDSNYAVDANYVHTDNNYTTTEKEKLSGISAGAEVNVNADWNATSGDAQILNKPTKVSDFTNDAGYLTEHQDISGKADKSEIPTKVSQLQNDSGYLTSFTETDPTVPAWAKAAQKPSYTAAEVGATTEQEVSEMIAGAIGQINSFDMAVVQALPTQNISTHTIYLVPKTGETNDVYDEYIYINSKWEMVGNTQIDLSDYALKSELPTKVSELSNDSGYLTSYTETDPTVPQWAKASTKPSYTAVEVGALPSSTHIPSTTAELTNDAGFITVGEVPVQDVQVNGTSIVAGNGVANIPKAASDTLGVTKPSSGLTVNSSGEMYISKATSTQVKQGTAQYNPLTPSVEHEAAFYGLAKAAGDSTQSASSNAVGTYTSEAKAAIKSMLGITQTITVTAQTQDGVTVTGQTVYLREDDASGPVYASAAYEGQPVSFAVPSGFHYYVSISDTLAHHFNPTTASGIVTDANISITLQYSDFSSIATAGDIKAALNAGMDLTDLVGEQITCAKGTDTLTWDVVDYDATNKSVKLLLHDAFGTANMVFEPAQALMWCENGLAAGAYTFKWNATQVYFTLATAIPAGGQLRANNTSFWTYESQSATATLETGTVSTTEIIGAADLGATASGLLNHHDRVSYGSNNFGESAIFWWLNSADAANTLRTPITKFSRAHSYNVPGFMYDLDSDFIDCLDDVDWRCSTNNVYECPASLGGITAGTRQTYTVNAKFGLASEMEIFGSYSGTLDGSTVFDLYNGAEATDRIKYRGTSAQVWWPRSPGWSGASYERYVSSSGGADTSYANYSCAVVPACQISKTAE